ncbi:hypothetical protein ACFL11_00150 [Patescibacteria group bacterium]
MESNNKKYFLEIVLYKKLEKPICSLEIVGKLALLINVYRRVVFHRNAIFVAKQRKELARMNRFDVFETVDTYKLGIFGDDDRLTICFSNADEGWAHVEFRVTQRGLILHRWEDGDEIERLVDVGELKLYILRGEELIPGWSNRAGLRFLNEVMNDEEELERRIEQVRDALGKCRNIVMIEAAAQALGM